MRGRGAGDEGGGRVERAWGVPAAWDALYSLMPAAPLPSRPHPAACPLPPAPAPNPTHTPRTHPPPGAPLACTAARIAYFSASAAAPGAPPSPSCSARGGRLSTAITPPTADMAESRNGESAAA